MENFRKQIQEMYKNKLVTVDKAAKMVKSGSWIDYGATINCPNDFDEALAKRVNELEGVVIRSAIGPYPHYTLEADPTGEHFVWSSWHAAGYDRKYIGKSNMFHCPEKLHENPMMIRGDMKKAQIAVMQVTPMDKHGYFNFGASATNGR